jgi:pyruvate dehydrogenase E2 component (dihydrolipoyllysine-residue acetyltransferase)
VAVEIVMPRLSDSMEEGTVARWLVEEGAVVARGQALVEIDTDKATMEYESESEGTLLQILVGEGETAAIGTPIARIGSPSEAADRVEPAAAPEPSAAPQGEASRPSPPVRAPRSNASPIAKRIAKELGIDLAGLDGTGPNGMITKEDVERAAEGDGARQGDGARSSGLEPLTRVQQAVARHMAEAAAVPTFAAEIEIDMTACAELRDSLEPRPSFNDLVVKACALALREHPRVNAAYTEQGFRYSERVNVGIAVAAEDALLVPVVHDADGKSLSEIARESRELAEKARAGKLTPPELDGGTFTVSNLGMHGVRRFEALLNTPQAAILAVGAVEPRPAAAADGSVTVRPLMGATLVCDHRILYGADGARFLARVRELLEQPGPLSQ